MNNVRRRTHFYAGWHNHLHVPLVLFLCIIVNFCGLAMHGAQLTKKFALTISPTLGFGRTHFIAGFPSAIAQKLRRDTSRFTHAATHENYAFFSDRNNIEKEMIALIDNEKKSIKMAIYLLTNPNVVHALISARERGVDVALVVDKQTADYEYSKVDNLEKAGITVIRKRGKNRGLMHNKFIIFEENESPLFSQSRTLVWTGSFNVTKSANTKNDENAVVLTDPSLVTIFTKYFDSLNETAVKAAHLPKTKKRHHPKRKKNKR